MSEQTSDAPSNMEPKQPTKFIIPAKRYGDDSKKTGDSMMRPRGILNVIQGLCWDF